jgi:hypothetical protein
VPSAAPEPGYISEVFYKKGDSEDFIEVVVPEGTEASLYSVVVYDKEGDIKPGLTYGLGSVSTTVNGLDLYVIKKSQTQNFADLKNDQGLALVRNKRSGGYAVD